LELNELYRQRGYFKIECGKLIIFIIINRFTRSKNQCLQRVVTIHPPSSLMYRRSLEWSWRR